MPLKRGIFRYLATFRVSVFCFFYVISFAKVSFVGAIMNFKIFAAAAALLATQSFAIIGIGGHYAPNIGTKMDASKAEAFSKAPNISFDHGDFKNMQGFGFKMWIDVLPIIDIEATYNIQFASYDAALHVKSLDGSTKDIPLEIELGGSPFAKATPKFVAMNGDLSITYPFTKLPLIRPYIGGGLTYYLNTFVLDHDFVEGLVNNQNFQNMITSLAENGELTKEKAAEIGEALKADIQKEALDEGLNTSIGGHVLVGFRIKPPIIPLAVYANFKYYIGGDFSDEIDAGHMAVEVGGGFAL